MSTSVRTMVLNIAVPMDKGDLKLDSWTWKNHVDDIYTASSSYKWLLERSRKLDTSLDWKWIWKSKAPAKIQFLIWLIVHDALPTNDTRARRGFTSSQNCSR